MNRHFERKFLTKAKTLVFIVVQCLQYNNMPMVATYRVKVASHPKCDHFGEKIFYDSKIDLTSIFVIFEPEV